MNALPLPLLRRLVRPIEEELLLLEPEPMDVPGDGPATIQVIATYVYNDKLVDYCIVAEIIWQFTLKDLVVRYRITTHVCMNNYTAKLPNGSPSLYEGDHFSGY